MAGNLLLARLSHAENFQLESILQTVLFNQGEVLYRVGQPVEHLYFPTTAVLSVLVTMRDGRAIETATVGNEGMVGLTALMGETTAPHQLIVQMSGLGYRIDVAQFKHVFNEESRLRQILARYHTAFMMQVSCAAACTGLHTVEQRCCRWLLTTQDRVGVKVLPLTQEFLSIMLGVRRASVSDVLRPLHNRGAIVSGRGRIEICDRSYLESRACECYQVVNEDFARLLGGND